LTIEAERHWLEDALANFDEAGPAGKNGDGR
jgi:hypothetical protein